MGNLLANPNAAAIAAIQAQITVLEGQLNPLRLQLHALQSWTDRLKHITLTVILLWFSSLLSTVMPLFFGKINGSSILDLSRNQAIAMLCVTAIANVATWVFQIIIWCKHPPASVNWLGKAFRWIVFAGLSAGTLQVVFAALSQFDVKCLAEVWTIIFACLSVVVATVNILVTVP